MSETSNTTGWNDMDLRAVDTARILAADAVQKVGSGHPGTAMSLAPAAYLLYQKVMRHDPADPHWAGRDRFVLSAGHSALTQYIQLYFSGYGLELDDLKALRTWGSKTPGHPEYRHTDGVEVTTGPLGQGVGNGVGLAMAERYLSAKYNRPGHEIIDHYTYGIVTDGGVRDYEAVARREGSVARAHAVARAPNTRTGITNGSTSSDSSALPRRVPSVPVH